ncbi:conserved hypothetical protein [Ricinus communis]|uniref:Uncharacterized protein n=1 Tax=Ricinus communis TaxID=3988 RepID=B9SLB9_RICCO|nr:conserved hypothetical protein [Ricinus communis]
MIFHDNQGVFLMLDCIKDKVINVYVEAYLIVEFARDNYPVYENGGDGNLMDENVREGNLELAIHVDVSKIKGNMIDIVTSMVDLESREDPNYDPIKMKTLRGKEKSEMDKIA